MRTRDAGRGPACGRHASPSEAAHEPALGGTCWLFFLKSDFLFLPRMQAASLKARWKGTRISLKKYPNSTSEWTNVSCAQFCKWLASGTKGGRLWAVTFVLLSISQPNVHRWWSTCHKRPQDTMRTPILAPAQSARHPRPPRAVLRPLSGGTFSGQFGLEKSINIPKVP